METSVDPSLCSTCNKPSAKYCCTGCKKYFCPKDFRQHEQQLAIKFDDEIVRSHDELLEQIYKLEKSNHFSLDMFDRIEKWKKTTISKVEKAAEKAHHELSELIDKQRIVITKQLEPITQEIRSRREEENFVENDIDRLRRKINVLDQTLKQFLRNDITKSIIINNDQINWNRLIYIRGMKDEQQNLSLVCTANLNSALTWIYDSVTVAGGNGEGNKMNQLKTPWGLCVDDDQTVYIADCSNHRIMEWKHGAIAGGVMAGGNRSKQLNSPRDVIIDKERNCFIICDYNNQRVLRWPRQKGANGETIISNVRCHGLTMDDRGFLYVVDEDNHEVRRYRMGESQGTVIAGGNGQGNDLNQLSNPTYVFVDQDHSVFVSDTNNHRVMKWREGAKQGIVVAGGQGQGSSLTQLSYPYGIVVDQLGTVYVADCLNNRIMRWFQGGTQGNVFIGGNVAGTQLNELYGPVCLSLDRKGNLYVSENRNHRVRKFNIKRL
ncbi:unnamed protein product [Rotaria sp. Silwood1]|nr:unnamed protein product [Rotaria sp. Silwood1]CAF1372179.1 unnamed protein product [Rotaria sp. Silwood1]CAF3574957.1 unnamed protein product [Rotaria sp. Silwood1]CAF3600387.1 unnamed protein product [Rotaria sp. Silwood1]CAF4647278.1 unnamed protein product [Rotaria sp. Silwood1]